MRKRRIILLIGAGASYGAGSILPERPPLGVQLFDELVRLFPNSWAQIPDDLQMIFKSNFENGMKIIWENYSTNVANLMLDMSEYFIQFRPVNNSSLYCKLASFLRFQENLESITFVSLNYDIILELSLVNNGFNINYFPTNKPNEKEISVLKIHGSSNFIATDVAGSKDISYGSGATFNGGIKASLDINEILENNLVKSGIAPVMSLYMEGKPINVSPNALKEIQKIYNFKASQSDIAFVIGVKPLKHDDHIWKPLINSICKIYYVGSISDFSFFKENNRDANHIGEYFNTSFTNIKKIINANY